MIFSSALAAISLACQDKIRVKLQGGHEAPPSLYTVSIAESGERKTQIDRLIFQGVRNFEKSFINNQESKHADHETAMEIWELERTALASSFQNAVKKGLPTDAQRLALELHNKLKPVLPKIPKLIYNDATPESIAWGLHTQWPSGGLISDEAGMVLGNHAGRNLPLLNKLRDGDSITVDRRSVESFTLSEPNFTLALMIQPKTFQHFLENQGKNARDIGFFSRCLMTYPESTQGWRSISNIQDVVWKDLPIFQARMESILHDGYKNNAQANKVTLKLSTEARFNWVRFYNAVEADMGDGRYLCDVRDAASKIAETSIRIAALFHHLEGRTGQIQVDTYEQARSICNWYLLEFKRIFGTKQEVPIEQLDAQQLELWLWEIFKKGGNYHPIRKNFIRQYCPNSLRTKNRVHAALWELARMDKISFGMIGRTDVIYLNQNYFTAQASSQLYYNQPTQSPRLGRF